MEAPVFYNTVGLQGEALEHANGKAYSQQEKIMHFFRLNPGKMFTPFEVQKYTNLVGTPITSIRRALSNLTIQGRLIKTATQKEGQYGKPNHTWSLKLNEPVQTDLFN